MKRSLKLKISFFVSLSVILIAIVTSIVYAAISRTSTRGEIEVSSAHITAETTYTSSTNSFDWTFVEAGDTKQINITTSNQTGIILHRFYNIQLASGFTSNENLLKAIIVYYNDNYVGVLNDIINTNPDIKEEYNFIGVSSNKTDNFKFELHQAALNSIFDNKDVKITITTYTENADYYKYIFVNNEAEFKKAMDDVNSGLFDETPSIVLCSNVTLEDSYTVSEPVKIYLNGSTLNGSLTLNDTTATNPNALIEVLGTGSFNVTVTLGANYDTEGAIELVKNRVKEAVASGLAAGSTTNVLGYYSFYGISVAAGTRCTYTAPNVVIASSSNEYYNALGSIRVNNDEDIIFKILGTKTALLDETLAYMPNDGVTITSDLFLPTYIPSQNANITWTSSDEDVITSTGMITAERLENKDVTLYAEIKVNNTIITRKYDFKVSVHNNEINFYKMVQEISPIVINNVRNSAADDGDALYHLPIVNVSDGTFGDYDYRTTFETPEDLPMFNWQAYKDIGLESITYSMTETQRNNYDYLTLVENSNELYLNTITLNNYAQITITGDFGNDETYTTNINISISVGSNTQLLEKAFTQVSEELEEISVLGNILSTRIENGMKNEKGDFTLSHAYTDKTTNTINEDYTIEYSGAENIIHSITYDEDEDNYLFTINPEYFNEYETTVAFTATVYYLKDKTGETSKSRTFYITVPAALHISDFGTISIYNSTKYQVFNQLPSAEKSGTSGYTKSGSSLTDSNLNYILLRDIVGDAKYLEQYNGNNTLYLDKINYTSANYATGTESLSYQTASTNPTSTTDTQAYDFARLIEWATGNTRALASSVVSNTSALGTLGSTKANAEDYLNNDEIAVLKQYYTSCTGANDTQWNSLFSEVFNVAPGYIYTNPALLNTVIKLLNNNGISFRSSTTNYSSLFGKYMEILQRYAVSTTKVNDKDVAPCQEQYNSTYTWYHSSTNLSSFSLLNSNGTTYTISVTDSYQVTDGTYWLRGGWPSGADAGSGGDGKYAGFFAISSFAADRTSYITEAERQVVMMFWLNVTGNNLTTSITDTNKTTISNVLSEYSDYYSDYNISHFNDVAHAIINAFDACMEIPTYFATDGVAKIIKSFYDKKDYKLPSYDETVTSSFVSSIDGNIPYITNADNIKSALSYFVNLKTLTFNGNENLAAFLSENGLSTVFARTGLYNKEITNLTMKHVAHTSVNFDLTNIKNFTKLTTLDVSYNSGIQSVNELVNVNRSNYTFVNIEHIGVEYAYQEFAIDNIASPTCTVWFTKTTSDGDVDARSNDNSRASDLADLSDFNKFITKYMYMTNVVYDENGNATSVTWRIDEGNEINSSRITYGGNYPSISTIDEMNQFISPYYYCSQSFTYNNLSFVSGNYYRVYYDNGVLKSDLLGDCISSSDMNQTEVISELNIDTSMPDSSVFSRFKYKTEITTNESVISSGTTTTYSTLTWYNVNSDFSKSITITITNSYKLRLNNNNNYGYLYNTNSYYLDGTNSNGASKYFFLNSDTITNIINRNYKEDTVINGINYTSISTSNTYYMCTIYNDKLYMVGKTTDDSSNDSEIYLTDTLSNALTIVYASSRFTFSNGKNMRYSSWYYMPVYHSQTNNCNVTATVQSNFTFSSSYDTTPFIRVNYIDGTYEEKNAYAAGYTIYKNENAVFEYTETESTLLMNYHDEENVYYMFYNGSNANLYNEYGEEIIIKPNTILLIYANYTYPVTSRSRTYRLSGTIYTWSLWYINNTWGYSNFLNGYDSGVQYIDGSLIDSVNLFYSSTHYDEVATLPTLPANTTTRTNADDWDDWSTTLTSSWEYDKLIFTPYISYVSEISQSSHEFLDTQSTYYSSIPSTSIEHIFLYTGSGSTIVYKGDLGESVVSYSNGYGYKLVIANQQLSWTQYSTFITNPTDTTMDSILTTANQHFNDYQYGVYYGKYYGYSGSNFYSELGYYYETGYIYRIMPNESNTAFTWVKVSAFTTTTTSNMLLQLGTGVLEEGDIVYGTGTAFASFFSEGWYKVVVDEKTNIVNLVKFNDLGFTTNGATTYTRLTNDKLVARSGDYLGYSGTFTVQISAMIRTYNSSTGTWTEYIKTYKLKFVGSLTS